MTIHDASFPVRLVYYVVRFLYTVISNLYCIPAYFIWMWLLLPLRFLAHDFYWKIECYVFKGLIAVVCTWVFTGGYNIIETGDDISSLYNDEVLLLCNHQSTGDVPVLMLCLYSKGMVSAHYMWIMDVLFRVTNFGVVAWYRGDFFIAQGKDGRQSQLDKLKIHMRESYLPRMKKWLVLFPEGGFLYKRLESSQRYAKKYGHPVLNHCTLPRIGAIQTVLNEDYPSCNENGISPTAKSRPLKWIVDTTIVYPDACPTDLHGMCIGYWRPRDIIMHHRAYPVSVVPKDTDGLTKWLYDRYAEKDEILSKFYSSNNFPDETDVQQRHLPSLGRKNLETDYIGVFIYHIFFIISTYLHIIYVYGPILNFIW